MQTTLKSNVCYCGCTMHLHLHCMQNVWFLLVLHIIISILYWLLFSINLNASHAAVQIPYITSDFQCKYFQLWWNRLTLCSHSSIHSFMVWSLFRVCTKRKNNENFHSATFIANIEHKTKCRIMQKLSVHELVIGLNVQRNGHTVEQKRSPEVNGFLLQYTRERWA